MGRIPRYTVDAIRDATSIVTVVERHVRLKRQGNSFVGLCPFHQEKTPSFHVVPSKGIFHCFGCSESGDVFGFLMKLEGLSFVEAVKELAGPAGVVVEERELSRAEQEALRRRATLRDIIEEAAAWYESVLWTRPEGAPGRTYLQQRGVPQALAREARLGFAPDEWTGLLDHLHSKGFPQELALAAGLARPRQRGGGAYDAFRGRVLFPIRDDRGRVIAFGGRLLEGDGPKYINTPETDFYQKSRVLYGLHAARRTIIRRDRLVLVEGYFDVLAMHAAGFQEAIATCGTALTEQHAERIRRLTRNVVVITDADAAGQRAAERALPLLLRANVQAWRVQIAGAKDPDELIQAEGPEAMERALEARQPLLEWVVRRKVEAAWSAGAQGARVALDELKPLLQLFPAEHPVFFQVAAALDLTEAEVKEAVGVVRRVSRPQASSPRVHLERPQVHLAWLLIHYPDEVATIIHAVKPALVGDGNLTHAIGLLLAGNTLSQIVAETDDPQLGSLLGRIASREDLYEKDTAADGCCEILINLARRDLRRRQERATQQIAAAEAAGDHDAILQAIRDKRTIQAEERALDEALDAGDHARCAALLAAHEPG